MNHYSIDHWVDRTDYIQDGYLFFFIKPQFNQEKIQERINYIIDLMPRDKEFFLCPVDIYQGNYPSNITVFPPITLDHYHQLIQKKFHKKPEKIIGITGSSGKTSTMNFLYQTYKQRVPSAYIGSNNCSIDIINYTKDHAISMLGFYEFLHKAAGHAVAILECTSYTIGQNRIKDIPLDGVIFTSFNEDHGDFHGGFLDYLLSKIKLINYLKPNGIVIINHNIKVMDSLLNLITQPVFLVENLWDFSNFYNQKNNIIFNKNIQTIGVHMDKNTVTVHNQWTFTLENNFLWQLNNIAMALVSYWLLENEIPSNFQWQAIEGRFNLLEKNDIKVVVDFGHSIEKVQYAINMIKKYLDMIQEPRKIAVVIGIGSKEINQRFPRLLWLAGAVDEIILTVDNIYGDFSIEPYVDMMMEYNNVTFMGHRQEAVQYGLNHYGNKDYIIACLGLGDAEQLTNKDIIMDYNEHTFIKNLLNDL
jgi:UDP-N-acetylmuramyl tripeptide synthase